MRGPFRDNQYAVTSGEPPDGTHIPLMASDDKGAREQATYLAAQLDVPLEDIRIYYCVQVTAFTRWVEIGHELPDYSQVIDAVFREFTE